MNSNFTAIQPQEIEQNVFELIGRDWMLITAGDIAHFNMMTACWGGFGMLWGGRKVCFCFIRPIRYTYEFVEKEDSFTLSFFDVSHKEKLEFCGKNSGRNMDKAAAVGLTPVEIDPKMVGFTEAKLIIECKKLYSQELCKENFIDTDAQKSCPPTDPHRMYIAEILCCYIRNEEAKNDQ